MVLFLIINQKLLKQDQRINKRFNHVRRISFVCKERPVTFTYWTKDIIYNDQITFGKQSEIRSHLL